MTPPTLSLDPPRTAPESFRELPRRDVRVGRDLAALRSWAQIGWKLWRLGVLSATDAAASLCAILVVVSLAHGLPIPQLAPLTLEPTLTLLMMAVQLLALGATGSYGQGIVRMDGGRVVRAILLTCVLVFLHAYAATGRLAIDAALAGAAAYALAATPAVLCGRTLVDRALRALRRAGFSQSRVVVVGSA
ncbi:MAG: hypothetical protein ICV87_09640, partial [Gemmatimonadetes bacterium]|nr:hypothetical protein [Gemmatimonadota bacterium]